MKSYSIPVWKMVKQALTELGGDKEFVPLINIVTWVRERWYSEDVNEGTIRCQARMRCVNGHPGHDSYPDRGKMWREQPTFVSDRHGRYRIFNPETDQALYAAALAEHVDQVYKPARAKKGVPNRSKQPQHKTVSIPPRIENVIEVLEHCGKKLGFQIRREWPVTMGRIDLVWYQELPVVLPQLASNHIPIVAFEIETSWRTRKHLKGDILNFQILQPVIGIIVQQTGPDDDPRQVDGLVRNTRKYLQTLSKSSLMVWTDADIQSLANSLDVPIISS